MILYGRLAEKVYKWRNRAQPLARITVLQHPNNPCQILLQMTRRLPNGEWGDNESVGFTGAVEELPGDAGSAAKIYLMRRLYAGMDQSR